MNMLEQFLEWLSNTAMATAIREGSMLFPWTESVHVLALTIVVGSIAIVDLRLLGAASRSRSVSKLMKDVLPITWVAFVVAFTTGILLFTSRATYYADNLFLQIKLVLLVLAGVNVLIFHLITVRTIAEWDAAARVPAPVRAAGAASLALWLGVVVFGRWIGFA